MKKLFQQYKLASLILMSILVLGSCSKYLDVPYPTNSVTTATAFESKSTIDGMMSNLYNQFRDNVELPGYFLDRMAALAGDAYNPTLAAQSVAYQNLYTNNMAPVQGAYLPPWDGFYQTIYSANVLMEGIPTSTATGMTEDIKKSYLAATKTIRAFAYFNLVRCYGGVPLVLDGNVPVNALLPRTSADSVYALIEKDLKDAITDLPADISSKYFIDNRFIPEAILAEVYLTEGKWAEAENLASDIINSGNYQLAALTDVFLQSSNEGILIVPAIENYQNANNNFKQGMSNGLIRFPTGFAQPFVEGNSNSVLSQDLLNSFEPGDQRAVNWVIFQNVAGYPDPAYRMYCYKYKYSFIWTADDIPAGTEEEDKVIRLAEIYLLRAEVRARQENLGDAADDLNMIRNRAGLGNTTATSQDDLINAVLNERRHELFFEGGYRWFDLVRTGLANTFLPTIPYKTNWKPYMVLFPLSTTSVLSKNPNLTQTPGY
ncbi:MAG: RagB/SusD family nutrient uptake outer membrane protein [Bacteroidetes bacterium]|nr:RagB/SusD family nutrient uptake outer membrane protein [Bacteroidota bacterium]MBS1973851.1 RagB/SusD family nutrient uptake outer membrane protein [Bacteroidota bacterium]